MFLQPPYCAIACSGPRIKKLLSICSLYFNGTGPSYTLLGRVFVLLVNIIFSIRHLRKNGDKNNSKIVPEGGQR